MTARLLCSPCVPTAALLGSFKRLDTDPAGGIPVFSASVFSTAVSYSSHWAGSRTLLLCFVICAVESPTFSTPLYAQIPSSTSQTLHTLDASSMHKQVNLSWMFFDFLYFGAAVACFVFAFAWRGFGGADPDRSHFLRRFLVTEKDTIAAIILGSWILASSALSIPAFIHTRRPGTKLKVLNAFNITVVMSTIASVAIGTAVWYFTLTERKSYMKVWASSSNDSQIWLQETLQCCGYWNATIAGLWTQETGFCGTAEVAANATAVQGCVTPITQLANSTLNNIFSTVYGFVVIESGLFLATCSLRVLKREDERSRKIDEKRGTKGGFV